jgi:hypothetical protein
LISKLGFFVINLPRFFKKGFDFEVLKKSWQNYYEKS